MLNATINYFANELAVAHILTWAGTIIYLLNHCTLMVWPAYSKKLYYIFNTFAAICVSSGSMLIQSWQSVGLNVFWVITSLMALSYHTSNIPFISLRQFNWLAFAVTTTGILSVFYSFGLSAEILGWVSVFLFCGCYFLFTGDKVSLQYYALINAIASIVIIPVLWIDQNWAVIVLEVCWFTISVYGWRSQKRMTLLNTV